MSVSYQLLKDGTAQLGLALTEQQLDSMVDYLELMLVWNKTHNLTSITQLPDMVVKHLLDSLSVYRYINQSSVLDVGCGAGLPSVPLAIALPDVQFTALDVSQKRIGFIKQFIRRSGLGNLKPVCSRVEDYQSPPFSLIYSRAFSSLAQFTACSRHLLAREGQWHAMKALDPLKEKNELPANVKLKESYALSVPGLDAERCLLVLEPSI